jgi:putative hemolysin
VVGEIDVGYDFEEYLPRRKRAYEMIDDETYLMDARMPISEAADTLQVNLQGGDAHTIGGLVMSRLRHIPTEGESIMEQGFRFTVDQANNRGIIKLKVELA